MVAPPAKASRRQSPVAKRSRGGVLARQFRQIGNLAALVRVSASALIFLYFEDNPGSVCTASLCCSVEIALFIHQQSAHRYPCPSPG